MRYHLTLLLPLVLLGACISLSLISVSLISYISPQPLAQPLWYVAYALGVASGFLLGYRYLRVISRVSPRQPMKMFAFLFASFLKLLGAVFLSASFYSIQTTLCFISCPFIPASDSGLASSLASLGIPIAFSALFAIGYLAYRLRKRIDVVVH